MIELIDADAGPRPRTRNHITTSLSIVESRSNTLVQRAVDPTKLEFLSQVYKRKDESHLLESAQKYLTTLHKVSEILSRAASVEALFDSIVPAILEVSGGDRAAILMRNKGTADVDMVAVRTKDGKASGAVTLSRTVVNDVLEKGISAFTDDALADERYVRRREHRAAADSLGDVRADAHHRRDPRRALRRQPDGAGVQRSRARAARRRSATRPASRCIARA